MKKALALKLLKNLRDCEPPGCLSTHVEHPYPPYRAHKSVEVAVVMEHRFAFLYWLKLDRELRHAHRSAGRPFTPPDLVTWDWHDDFGVDGDVDKATLAAISRSTDDALALYCWAGLPRLNDGHIRPAVWLNAIANVYIVQKQKRNTRWESGPMKDRYGRLHQIFYFRSLRELPKALSTTASGGGIIWDVDLDYFTATKPDPNKWYTPAFSERKVKALLSPRAPWMPMILGNLKAVTIALEPQYTGGLTRSLELFRHWESSLFASPVFDDACRWRETFIRQTFKVEK